MYKRQGNGLVERLGKVVADQNGQVGVAGFQILVAVTVDDRQVIVIVFLRDKAAGLHPDVPCNYYPDDDDTRAPICSWRSSANLLYCNWLNYFVYQATPYDLNRVGIVVMDDFKEQHE